MTAVVALIGGLVAARGGGGHTPADLRARHDDATTTLTGPLGPEGIALETGSPLAPAATPAEGAPVDGIRCEPTEQVAYHVHTHLTIYVDGRLRPLPAGIGIVNPAGQQTPEGPFYGATQCYYWLHVHAQDGVIHIESPTTGSYTLGQFFAIWGQVLSPGQVGPAKGAVTAFVDGLPYRGDPAAIRLGSREDVQLEVASAGVPPRRVDWSHSHL